MIKKITNIKPRSYDSLVNHFIEPIIKSQKRNDKQKIIEICHIGKFLMEFDNITFVEEVSEKPEFILNQKGKLIGLEHQIIVEKKSREREGIIYNIFELAEIELQKDKSLPNFLANCFTTPYLSFKLNQKRKLIDEVVNIIKHFIKTNQLIENHIIDDIFIQSHSQINISPNLGGWFQRDITQEIIQKSIDKKDKLINSYKTNVKENWLLLVIGGLGESSYRIDNLEKVSIESKFDRVYVLEDFYSNLYQLK